MKNSSNMSLPKSVAFKITYDCNLNCKMCGQNRHYKEQKNVKRYLEINVLKDIIDQVYQYSPQIYIWGGEPLLYPHLQEFVEYINMKSLPICITTNGVILNRHYKYLVDLRVAELTLSIDGPEHIHNQIRGKDVFSIVVENLRQLNEYKELNKKQLPIIDLHIVVVNDNYKYLYEFVNYINQNKLARRIRIQLPMFFTKNMSEKFHCYLNENFNVLKTNNLSCDEYIMNFEIDTNELKTQINQIRQAHRNVYLFPSIFDIDNWFSNPEYTQKEKCMTPNARINIEPNGDLITCPNFSETVYGNVFDGNVIESFQNNIIQNHRNNLSQQLAGICPRCSYLYLYDEN